VEQNNKIQYIDALIIEIHCLFQAKDETMSPKNTSSTSVFRSGKTAREYAQLKGHRSVEEFLQ